MTILSEGGGGRGPSGLASSALGFAASDLEERGCIVALGGSMGDHLEASEALDLLLEVEGVDESTRDRAITLLLSAAVVHGTVDHR